MENLAKLNSGSSNAVAKEPSKLPQPRPQQQFQQKAAQKDMRVEHQFLNKMPDINSVENDLMKLLNDFSETRLKKYGTFSLSRPFMTMWLILDTIGTSEIHEKLFQKMDAIRDKQEKIAKVHFEQDNRLTESKYILIIVTLISWL